MNPFCPDCGMLLRAKSQNYEVEGKLRKARSRFWVCYNPKCKYRIRIGRGVI